MKLKTLAAGLVRLERTDIEYANNFSEEKINCLFNKMAVSPVVNIINLNLGYVNCSSVDPEVFADAIIRVENVTMNYIDEDQAIALFHLISRGQNIGLKTLGVNGSGLEDIPACDFSEAVVKLEEVDLMGSFPTEDQIQGIFNMITSSENLRLRRLDLEGNIDVFESEESADDLIRAISRLEEFNFIDNNLSEEQVTAIFNMVAERRTGKLKKINIGEIGFDEISEDLRERAEMNEEVELDYALM